MPKLPPRDLSHAFDQITFRCPACKTTFEAAPVQIDPAPERDWHPFRYFGHCECGRQVGQVGWEQALFKAWANATGPRTEAGKAASAANLEGHPTAEAAQRTRFNAMKHGLNAKVATFFPSKPDKYDFCSGCDVDRDFCRSQPACTQQTQLFLQVHAAFETGDSRHLRGITGQIQAGALALLQMMMQSVIADGVQVRTPQWYHTKDGKFHLAEYIDPNGDLQQIYDLAAHPLLKPLIELLGKNSLSLGEQGLTPKAQEEQDGPGGRLSEVEPETLSDFAARNAAQVDALQQQLGRAQAHKARDPVLIEYQQQGRDDADK